jgi:uncharacterized protein (UPF0264 family)
MAESALILAAGARWLDLKEPSLGSLGRPSLDLIFNVLELDIPESVQVSVAGGELRSWTPDLDASLAARLPARAYLKLALADCKDQEWQSVAERISRALVRRSQLILVHYADAVNSNAPTWQEVIETTKSLGGKFVLIDTFCKESGGLLDCYSPLQLEAMIDGANQQKLGIALAGSLKWDQLQSLSNSRADWLGVRGAVCHNTQRTGEVCPNKLQQVLALFTSRSSNRS